MRDGDGSDALEEDDDDAVALDALDDAFDTCEVAVDDADTFALLVEVVAIGQVAHMVVVRGGDADEVFHGTTGHHNDLGLLVVGTVAHHIL